MERELMRQVRFRDQSLVSSRRAVMTAPSLGTKLAYAEGGSALWIHFHTQVVLGSRRSAEVETTGGRVRLSLKEQKLGRQDRTSVQA